MKAALKYSTKFPSPEMMIEVYEPSKPLSELRHWPYHIVHPIALVHARNFVAFANGTIVTAEDASHRFREVDQDFTIFEVIVKIMTSDFGNVFFCVISFEWVYGNCRQIWFENFGNCMRNAAWWLWTMFRHCFRYH